MADSLHRPKSLTRAQGTRGNVYPVGASKVLILELQDKQLLVESTSINPPSGKGRKLYSCRDLNLLQLMQRGTCYKEERSSSAALSLSSKDVKTLYS